MVVAVDLVAGWMQEGALGAMSLKGEQRRGIAEAEFANIDRLGRGEGCWVRRKVPGLNFVSAHLHTSQISHAADFGLILRHTTTSAEFLNLFLT